MKYADFRDFPIERTCKIEFKTVSKYREYLRTDFKKRCGYCNVSDELFTNKHEIDHFIPRKFFENKSLFYLDYDYSNLVYCCKKCNLAKADKYESDGKSIDNIMFADPAKIDYNKLFYRNEYGRICSNNNFGNKMIIELKLYRPIHNIEFILDELNSVISLMERKLNEEKKLLVKNRISIQLNKLRSQYINFTHIYNEKYKSKFFIECNSIISP